MSRRIAHRPRYRDSRQFAQPLHRLRQEFLHKRWAYRHHSTRFEKQPLGHSLSLFPVHRFARGIY